MGICKVEEGEQSGDGIKDEQWKKVDDKREHTIGKTLGDGKQLEVDNDVRWATLDDGHNT